MPRLNIDVGRIRTETETEEIIKIIEQDPTLSTRAISCELDISHVTVHRILKSEPLYSFHCTEVQKLNVRDHCARENFYYWLLQNNKADENFLANIMWTDEVLIYAYGYI